jgi:hypothetical protein
MSDVTILFESVEAATKAFRTLKPMIDVSLDCNALTFDEIDEELVKWLVEDDYVTAGAGERVYIYPVSIVSKTDKTTLYQYQDLQIEQKFIPPADWEFVTRDRFRKTINRTWWGYEDGKIDIGFYIENFLERCKVVQ